MPGPSVAVVIVHYETWSVCLSCIDSVIAQELPRATVVVVDNNSSSPPPGRLLHHTTPLKLIQNRQNLGFAAAANQGIREAQRSGAEFIWLLNPDTRVMPGSLQALLDTARRDPAIGAVGSVLLEEDDSGQVQAWGGGRVSFLSGLPRHLKQPGPSRLNYICGASMLLRVKALESVDGFDERFFLYWEDTDLSFRLRKQGWRLAVAESSRVMHRQSLSTVFQSPFYDRCFTRSSVLFFKKHAPYWPLPLLVSCCGRSLRRLVKGETANALAVWSGALSGLKTVGASR